MQFYKYDRVAVKDGVFDEESLDDDGQPINLSGLVGIVTDIGARNEEYPIKVDVYDEVTGFYKEYKFKPEELELEENIESSK